MLVKKTSFNYTPAHNFVGKMELQNENFISDFFQTKRSL